MIVVPAIDLRGGRVVRLRQGRAEEETVYAGAPAEVARRFEAEGARRIHVVDLDAAMDGLRRRRRSPRWWARCRIPVEVGGGVRTLEDAVRLRDHGVERVIFGTAAVSRPDVVQAALAAVARGGGGGDRRARRPRGRARLERDDRRGRARARGHGRGLGRAARAVHRRAARRHARGPEPGGARGARPAHQPAHHGRGRRLGRRRPACASRRSSGSAWTRRSWARRSTRAA